MCADICLQVVEEGTVKLKHLQVLGKTGTCGGLAIFPQPVTAVSPSAQHQARHLLYHHTKREAIWLVGSHLFPFFGWESYSLQDVFKCEGHPSHRQSLLTTWLC